MDCYHDLVYNRVPDPTFWHGSGLADLYRWTTDPDPASYPGSCSFLQWLSRCQQKIKKILKLFFAYHFRCTCNRTFASSFEDNNLHYKAEIKVFHDFIILSSLFLLFDGRTRIPIGKNNYESGSRRPKDIRNLRIRIRNTDFQDEEKNKNLCHWEIIYVCAL